MLCISLTPCKHEVYTKGSFMIAGLPLYRSGDRSARIHLWNTENALFQLNLCYIIDTNSGSWLTGGVEVL